MPRASATSPAAGRDPEVAARFRAARRDPALTVVEGLHALKHALRFGAGVREAVAPDPAAVASLAEALAPDVAPRIAALVAPVDAETFAALVPRPPRTGVVAIAARPAVDPAAVLSDPREAPVVLLDDPRDLRNAGACVRVAAAAGAAGVLTTGTHDPWHPDAVRGAAGLQWALPVARLEALPDVLGRPLVALDPGAPPLRPGDVPPRAVLAFGGERRGLGAAVLARADLRAGLPMREGVSSINLAASVAAVLYALRLSAG